MEFPDRPPTKAKASELLKKFEQLQEAMSHLRILKLKIKEINLPEKRKKTEKFMRETVNKHLHDSELTEKFSEFIGTTLEGIELIEDVEFLLPKINLETLEENLAEQQLVIDYLKRIVSS